MNWKNSQWKQKYKCKNCTYCFVRKNRTNDKIKKEKLLNDYVLEWYSNRQLSNQHKKKEYLVRKYIQNKLDNNQIKAIDIVYDNVSNIIIDWYWLPWKRLLLVYYEYVIEKVIWFSICDWERKENIVKDLKILKNSFSYNIKTCTIDWWISIFGAIILVYPNITIQRCLVHIQRQVLSYISRNPKLKAWKELKHLVSYKILSDSLLFPLMFNIWKKSNFYFLTEKRLNLKWWYSYKHEKIRKAMKHIENALPYMFNGKSYIEISSNKLEWYFWVLTNECINEHKWIREDRLSSLIALWIYFRNEK